MVSRTESSQSFGVGEMNVQALREAAMREVERGGPDASADAGARAMLAWLDADASDGERAVRDALESLLKAISQNYFAQDWAAEHEFSVWARLTDDGRAWGYGSADEIGPLRWLVELTGCWFDGHRLVTIDEWRPRFDAWADEQLKLVRRMTPGALDPSPFPRHD
jgi:hypothetical protein